MRPAALPGTIGVMEETSRPRLRGVFHFWAFFGSLVAGIVLVSMANGGRARLAAVIYVVALAAMFGASALYHRYPFRSAGRRAWARRLDHSTIFIFIAGTNTPFALLRFTGATPTIVLAAVWGGTVLGLILNLAWIDAPKWLTALAYLSVGWVAVVAAPQLFSHVGVTGSVLILVGGALYTLGAVIYAFRWPNPFPATFGFHELFHVLVVAAAVTQFVSVSLVVT
jgi:hemolysin III